MTNYAYPFRAHHTPPGTMIGPGLLLTEQGVRQYERRLRPLWANIDGLPDDVSTAVNLRSFNVLGDGENDDSLGLELASQQDGKILQLLPGEVYYMGSNRTLAGPVIGRGGVIKPGQGVIVTIAGPFEAGLYQCFDTSEGGAVVVQRADPIRPEWWGDEGLVTHSSPASFPQGIAAPEIEELQQAVATVGDGIPVYTTRAALYANLSPEDGSLARVTRDGENNGLYVKVGSEGEGVWEPYSYDRVSIIEDHVLGLIGGYDVSDQTLKEWTEAEAYQVVGSVERNDDGVVLSATVRWPDGSTGVMIATATNATWLTVDAYTITHALSGRTVTQPAVTRDTQTGGVLIKPELTVS